MNRGALIIGLLLLAIGAIIALFFRKKVPSWVWIALIVIGLIVAAIGAFTGSKTPPTTIT